MAEATIQAVVDVLALIWPRMVNIATYNLHHHAQVGTWPSDQWTRATSRFLVRVISAARAGTATKIIVWARA